MKYLPLRELNVDNIISSSTENNNSNKAQNAGSNPKPENQNPCPPFCYHAPSQQYWFLNETGMWLPQSTSRMKRRMRLAEVARDQHDAILQLIEDRAAVTWIGSLAGKRSGIYVENGHRILVTESPTRIEPASGNWSTIRLIIEGLLVHSEPEHGQTQWDTFMGWLQTAVAALRKGMHQSAQALAIAGPIDSGKSLLQHLITNLLGGRAAKGHRYMNGKTQFNEDLFGAEHIMLEDEYMDSSISAREKLGANIKNFTVSTLLQSCHGKFKTAISLPVWWRLTITLNDDSKSLRVLPPMDSDIEDKIILLHASKFPMPMPTETAEEQELFWAQLVSEIPAFLDWLLNVYEIPEALRNRRYTVKTWHHPVLREALEELSKEAEFLALIDDALEWPIRTAPWQGTSSQLRQILLANNRTARMTQRLAKDPAGIGKLLANIHGKWPDRVMHAQRTAKQRKWLIYPPADDPPGNDDGTNAVGKTEGSPVGSGNIVQDGVPSSRLGSAPNPEQHPQPNGSEPPIQVVPGEDEQSEAAPCKTAWEIKPTNGSSHPAVAPPERWATTEATDPQTEGGWAVRKVEQSRHDLESTPEQSEAATTPPSAQEQHPTAEEAPHVPAPITQ